MFKTCKSELDEPTRHVLTTATGGIEIVREEAAGWQRAGCNFCPDPRFFQAAAWKNGEPMHIAVRYCRTNSACETRAADEALQAATRHVETETAA